MFKPADEEPYGTLNPKMVKVRSQWRFRSSTGSLLGRLLIVAVR